MVACAGTATPGPDRSPEAFERWASSQVPRCAAGAGWQTRCEPAACVLLLEVSDRDPKAIQACMDWPWTGSGRRTRTLECPAGPVRIQAISQLPPLTEQTTPEVLSAQAERVDQLLAAQSCESIRAWKPSESAR